MRLGAVTAAAALATMGAAGSAGAASGDGATRADLAGAAFRPLTLRDAPAAAAKGPVFYVEAFIPGRGLVRWATPAAETGRLQPLAPPSGDIDDLVSASNGPATFRGLETGGDRVAVGSAPAFAAPTGPGGTALEIGSAYGARKASNPLGLREGNRSGDAGRWFLFAALRGRAIGWNMMGGPDNHPNGGLSLDSGGFAGQGQAGLGYRRGALQASLGYVYERVRFEAFGIGSRVDNRLGLTVSWRTGVVAVRPTPTP